MKYTLIFSLFLGPSLAWCQPNWSGTWILNRQASQLAQEGPPIPEQFDLQWSSSEVKVIPQEGDSATYPLDGRRLPFQMNHPGPMGMRLRGQGERTGSQSSASSWQLNDDIRVSTPLGDKEVQMRQTWTLEAGGRRLVIESLAQTPRGRQQSHLIYERP